MPLLCYQPPARNQASKVAHIECNDETLGFLCALKVAAYKHRLNPLEFVHIIQPLLLFGAQTPAVASRT